MAEGDCSKIATNRRATNHNEQQGEDFLKELRKCGEKSNKDTVWRILQKTIDVLETEVLAVPQKNRIEILFENYPVFKNPIHLVQHLANILPEATLMKVRQNLRTATETILDYLFSKNMVNVSRSALIDDEVKTLVAFVHLPKIGGKLSLHHTPIHAVKNEDLPDQVAAEHKPRGSARRLLCC
ncbi:uncharacterized protein [Argopecten irradians]|uniref:uncharacterized protein n=1 Tax=Argopecten irradians TaxID=31199 RepID=UPI0037174DDA